MNIPSGNSATNHASGFGINNCDRAVHDMIDSNLTLQWATAPPSLQSSLSSFSGMEEGYAADGTDPYFDFESDESDSEDEDASPASSLNSEDCRPASSMDCIEPVVRRVSSSSSIESMSGIFPNVPTRRRKSVSKIHEEEQDRVKRARTTMTAATGNNASFTTHVSLPQRKKVAVMDTIRSPAALAMLLKQQQQLPRVAPAVTTAFPAVPLSPSLAPAQNAAAYPKCETQYVPGFGYLFGRLV